MSDREVVEWMETTEDVIIMEECVLPNGGSSTAVLQVSESTETPIQKLLDPMVQGEDAEFDDGFYCDECRSLFQQQSGICITGPSFILDSPAHMATPQRALLTLPHGLMIGRSSVPNAGLGVMNQGPPVTPGMHFGPYEGDVTSRDDAVASRFSWEIYRVNEDYSYIDAARETHSNWMRYVNCARSQEETNLLVVQYKGSILFHCCRTILPGDELLLWPSMGLASRLTEAWSHIWLRKLAPIDMDPGVASQTFLCAHCPLSFTTETYRQRHADHFHAERAPGDPAFEAKTCSECGKIFKHAHHLKRHLLAVHSNKRPYCCPRCRRSFGQASGLLRHQLVHDKQGFGQAAAAAAAPQSPRRDTGHAGGWPSLPDTDDGGGADGAPEDGPRAPGEPTDEGGPLEEAEGCSVEEAEGGSLEEAEGGPLEDAEGGPREEAEGAPLEEAEGGPLEEAEGGTPEEAEGMASKEKKPNACGQCDKSFSNARYLEKHQTRVHGTLRPYVCTLCRKTFSQHNDLARHLKSHQAKEKDASEKAPVEGDGESSEASTDDPRGQDAEEEEDPDFVAEPSAPETPEPPKEPAYQRPQRLGVRSKISAITKLIAPKRRAPVQKRKARSPARIAPEEEEEGATETAVRTPAPEGRTADDGGPYGCPRCHLNHDSRRALQEHACTAVTAAPTAPHKCDCCGAVFKKAGFLRRHERTAHGDAKSHACDVCGKAFSKLFNLKQHQKIKSCDKHHCTSEIFPCPYCPFSFTIRGYLRKHVRRHHPVEFVSLSESERLADGPEEGEGEEEEEPEEAAAAAAAGEGTRVCPKCGKKCAGGKKYAAHRCLEQVVLYLCTDCGKGFTNHYSLKQHQRVHTGVRPHHCPHCLKTFVHMGQLNVHLRTHTGEKPYLCTHCGESFRQSGDLKRHERKHTGVRPHGCPQCFKSFSRPQSLRAHLLLHLGQRMFKCDDCGKSFSRNYHLRRHQQKMHS